MFLFSKHGRCLAFQHKDTFVLIMVKMMFSCVASGFDFDNMKAKPGEASHIAQAFVDAFGIGVEEVGLCESLCYLDVFFP